MAKTIEITIKESEEQLRYLLRKQDKLLQQGQGKGFTADKTGQGKIHLPIGRQTKTGTQDYLQLAGNVP